jgi:O-methyltransferase domain
VKSRTKRRMEKTSLRRLCRAGSAARVSGRDERNQFGCGPCHRQLSMERLHDLYGSWFTQGMVHATLARAHLSGVGFDLPSVKPVFEEFIAHQRVSDRVRFQAGNSFKDILPKADVIVMGHILHDWDLVRKRCSR